MLILFVCNEEKFNVLNIRFGGNYYVVVLDLVKFEVLFEDMFVVIEWIGCIDVFINNGGVL